MRRLFFIIFALAGCSSETSDTFTLYRNAAISPNMRIHVASFDARESGPTYNAKNCAMAARL